MNTLLPYCFAAITAAADLKTILNKGAGILMIIGGVGGIILIMSGALKIKNGDAESGKWAILAGGIIAAAPAIVKVVFMAAGMGDAVVEPDFNM